MENASLVSVEGQQVIKHQVKGEGMLQVDFGHWGSNPISFGWESNTLTTRLHYVGVNVEVESFCVQQFGLLCCCEGAFTLCWQSARHIYKLKMWSITLKTYFILISPYQTDNAVLHISTTSHLKYFPFWDQKKKKSHTEENVLWKIAPAEFPLVQEVRGHVYFRVDP